MQFKNLEAKCRYYQSLSDYKLLPNSYVLVHIDGRSFSHLVKNKFQKPFDDDFIEMMNETAKYVCENVQGAKFAFVQSDEISFVLTDFDTPTTDAFFNNRLCKMQSIIASLATAKFNQLMFQYKLLKFDYDRIDDALYTLDNAVDFIGEQQLYQFDCKCWNVPSLNDVFAWFLYRQIDCIRNSKQQTAQTYLTHKELLGKDTDTQIKVLYDEKGINWYEFDDSKKFGRFVWKELIELISEQTRETYTRHKWLIKPAWRLTDETGKESFFNLDKIPKIK